MNRTEQPPTPEDLSRRKFLKRVGMSALLAALSPQSVLAKERKLPEGHETFMGKEMKPYKQSDPDIMKFNSPKDSNLARILSEWIGIQDLKYDFELTVNNHFYPDQPSQEIFFTDHPESQQNLLNFLREKDATKFIFIINNAPYYLEARTRGRKARLVLTSRPSLHPNSVFRQSWILVPDSSIKQSLEQPETLILNGRN